MTVEEKVKPNMPNITENFTEVLRNGIELEMIAIPAGDFILLGDKPTVVKLKGFWMSKYPITQAQYEAIMYYNPSYFRGDGNCPVEQVTWDNAQEFCGKLSEKTGKSYRLPSEVQWVYSCKAGSTTGGYFGEDAVDFGEYAWYEKNSDGRTHPVGQKKPNQWGLYDMYGNVSEWCQDSYIDGNEEFFRPKHPDQSYTSYPSHIYPTDGSAFVESGNEFVIMGFILYYDRVILRSGADRDFLVSGPVGSYTCVLFQPYGMARQIGFRVVCVP